MAGQHTKAIISLIEKEANRVTPSESNGIVDAILTHGQIAVDLFAKPVSRRGVGSRESSSLARQALVINAHGIGRRHQVANALIVGRSRLGFRLRHEKIVKA